MSSGGTHLAVMGGASWQPQCQLARWVASALAPKSRDIKGRFPPSNQHSPHSYYRHDPSLVSPKLLSRNENASQYSSCQVPGLGRVTAFTYAPAGIYLASVIRSMVCTEYAHLDTIRDMCLPSRSITACLRYQRLFARKGAYPL